MPITTSGGRKLADGIFGSETTRVVRQFQTLNGLQADGIVGRQTLQVLEQLIGIFISENQADFITTTNLPPGFANSYHRTSRRPI